MPSRPSYSDLHEQSSVHFQKSPKAQLAERETVRTFAVILRPGVRTSLGEFFWFPSFCFSDSTKYQPETKVFLYDVEAGSEASSESSTLSCIGRRTRSQPAAASPSTNRPFLSVAVQLQRETIEIAQRAHAKRWCKERLSNGTRRRDNAKEELQRQ